MTGRITLADRYNIDLTKFFLCAIIDVLGFETGDIYERVV